MDCIKHGDLTTSWELVTPAKAEDYLKNKAKNRNMVMAAKANYQQDMRSGDWVTTHEGIAFNSDGHLVDGQHRLSAIIESGVSVWMLVTRGLRPEAIEVINRGRSRTLAHALQIIGHDICDNRSIAIARRMMFGPASSPGNQHSQIRVRRFIEDNAEAITFASSAGKRMQASASAVIGRAFYHADEVTLHRFVSAVLDDIPFQELQPRDSSARKLGSYLAGLSKVGGGYVLLSMYRKTQAALRAFLDGKEISRLVEVTEDLFPLPASRTSALRDE